MSGAARSRSAPPRSPPPAAAALGPRRLHACVSTCEGPRAQRMLAPSRLPLERARTAGPRRVAVRPFREDHLLRDSMGRDVGQQHLASEGRDESGRGFCTGGSARCLGEMADQPCGGQRASRNGACAGSLPLSFGRSPARRPVCARFTHHHSPHAHLLRAGLAQDPPAELDEAMIDMMN